MNDTNAKTTTVDELVAGVMTWFLQHEGEAATVKELAGLLNWTEAKVRRAVDETFMMRNGWTYIQPTEKSIQIREKSFLTVVSERMVRAYQPTRSYLAVKLNQANALVSFGGVRS